MTKYMGGVGIQEKTRRISAALWDALPAAVLGSTVAILGPFILGMLWIAPSSDIPWWAFVIAAFSSVGGIYISLPWWRAKAALKKHRLAMEAETDRRGAGWAES